MFKFSLGEKVVITLTNKKGSVEGRAEYNSNSDNQYQLNFINGVGDAVYSWFEERDLEGAV